MKRPEQRVLDVLEKVFCREIMETLPYQSKAKICEQLVEQGLLSHMELKLPSALGSITVRGYTLTHAGRIMYGESCTAAAPKAGKGDA